MRDPKSISLARNLRRNESDAERKLWSKLRSRQFDNLKFRRQHPIGKYIVDFVSIEKKIIVEVDGSQHMKTVNIEHDAQRTKYFEDEGYTVLRFLNYIKSNRIKLRSHLTPSSTLLSRRASGTISRQGH